MVLKNTAGTLFEICKNHGSLYMYKF